MNIGKLFYLEIKVMSKQQQTNEMSANQQRMLMKIGSPPMSPKNNSDLFFPVTGQKGIPDQDSLMVKAVEEDYKIRRRFPFLNDRQGSLGVALQERASWSVKLANFQAVDSANLNCIDAGYSNNDYQGVSEKILDRDKVYKLKQEVIKNQMSAVSRDQPVTYDMIVDNKGKTLTNFNLFSKDFVTNIDQNEKKLEQSAIAQKQYHTLTSIKGRRRTVTIGDRPQPLKHFKTFYEQQTVGLNQWQSKIDKLQKEKQLSRETKAAKAKQSKTVQELKAKNRVALKAIAEEELRDKRMTQMSTTIKCNFQKGQNPFDRPEFEGKNFKISSTMRPHESNYKTGYDFLRHSFAERYNYEQKYANHSNLHSSFIKDTLGFDPGKEMFAERAKSFNMTVGGKTPQFEESKLNAALSPTSYDTRSQTMLSRGQKKDEKAKWSPNIKPNNKTSLFEDEEANDLTDGLRFKAQTPNLLLPEKKQSAVDYDLEKRMFKTGDALNSFLSNQTQPVPKGQTAKPTPLKPPEFVIPTTVRYSNNPDDTDIDLIIEKLMKNRSWHKDFDPVLGREKVRFFIRDLIFSSSDLQSYKQYVDRDKQRINEAEMKLLSNKMKIAEIAEQQALEAEMKANGIRPPAHDAKVMSPTSTVTVHPGDKGANLKDMQRAFWINFELSRKPYFGFDQADESDEEIIQEKEEEGIELDPEFILAQQRENERIKEYDMFISRVHQVFDPLSFISKETSKLNEETKDSVYDIQLQYRKRLMDKHANNNVYGQPDYLKRFKAQDPGLPAKLAKEVLSGKFDYKKENMMLDDFVKTAERWNFCGGPLTKEVLDQYPGAKAYIEHLRKRFGLNYRIWKPPSKDLRGSSLNIPLVFQTKKHSGSKKREQSNSSDKNDNSGRSKSKSPRNQGEVNTQQRSLVTIGKISSGGRLITSNSEANFKIQPQQSQNGLKLTDRQDKSEIAKPNPFDGLEVNTRIGGMSSDKMSDGLTGNQSATLGSPTSKQKSQSVVKNKMNNKQNSVAPTDNATTRVDQNTSTRRNDPSEMENVKYKLNHSVLNNKTADLQNSQRKPPKNMLSPNPKAAGKTERLGNTKSETKNTKKEASKVKALTNTMSPKFGQKQDSASSQPVTEQIMGFDKMLSLNNGKGMHTLINRQKDKDKQGVESKKQESLDNVSVLEETLSSPMTNKLNQTMTTSFFGSPEKVKLQVKAPTVKLQPTKSEKKEIRIKQKNDKKDKQYENLKEINDATGQYSEEVMGRWLKQRKKRRQWRLEERQVWNKIDQEDANTKQEQSVDDEDQEPEDTEDEEERYMQTLFEMRRLAWMETQKDPNDVYARKDVQTILKNNWIRLIVRQSKKTEQNFDITLNNLNKHRKNRGPMKGRSHTMGSHKMGQLLELQNQKDSERGSIMDDVSMGRSYQNQKQSAMNVGDAFQQQEAKKALKIQQVNKILDEKRKFGPNDFPCSRGHVEVDYMTPKERFEFEKANKPKQQPIDIPEVYDDARSSCSGTTRGSLALRGLKTSIGQLGKAKDLRNQLDTFLEKIDDLEKYYKSLKNHDGSIIQAIQATYKETKRIRLGIEKFIDMMETNPNSSDMQLTVFDFIQDYLVDKHNFKTNIKNVETIDRIKKENQDLSLKIANYGQRQLWQPSKLSNQLTKREGRIARKAPLIRFNADGQVINE